MLAESSQLRDCAALPNLTLQFGGAELGKFGYETALIYDRKGAVVADIRLIAHFLSCNQIYSRGREVGGVTSSLCIKYDFYLTSSTYVKQKSETKERAGPMEFRYKQRRQHHRIYAAVNWKLDNQPFALPYKYFHNISIHTFINTK